MSQRLRDNAEREFELPTLDQIRRVVSRDLDPQRKAELGQFMTPSSLADFMASLFSPQSGSVRLLDAGAGVGSLTDAFLRKWREEPVEAWAYEIDPDLIPRLKETLDRYRGHRVDPKIIERDFIEDAVYGSMLGAVPTAFTHAILNPPYKKISSDSSHRALLRIVGLETVNLYSAFVGLAIRLMADGGQVVAIIPRSFCNGLYFKPFREWVLQRCSLDHIHLFHSRKSAFHEDAVLQENVVVKFVRGKQQGPVTITTSTDTSFHDLQSNDYPFSEIVQNANERFIHVPVSPAHSGLHGVPLAVRSLDEIGLEVSTGPVVDFRLKEFLKDQPLKGTSPLLYPTHFSGGSLRWPKTSRKPNAIVANAATQKWLYPTGFYTVVRRFSSKEERRRVVAHVVDPGAFESETLGFENHLNVFHSKKKGLGRLVAHGLSVFLNSTAVDEYFRRFSGHTQVNATDLRLLRYPEPRVLEYLGSWAQQQKRLTQELIDQQIVIMHAQTQEHL